MALTEQTFTDQIEVVKDSSVQVRVRNVVLRDGTEIASQNRRYVIAPGDDYASEDERVQAICAAVHTPEAIAAYQAAQQTDPRDL